MVAVELGMGRESVVAVADGCDEAHLQEMSAVSGL